MSFDLSAANSYGQALFLAAKDKGVVAQALDDAKAIVAAEEKAPMLVRVLSAPHISKEDKMGLVRRALEGKVEKLILNFILMLLQRDRIEIFDTAIRRFQKEAEKDQGISHGYVRSAMELSEAERAQVHASLEKSTGLKLTVDYIVDPTVIGGLVFKCGDLLIDNSLRSSLERLEEHLMATNVI